MECMQAAELTHHEFAHEGGKSVDSFLDAEDLFVEELLDLENVEFEDGGFRGKEEEEKEDQPKYRYRFGNDNPNYSGEFSESPLASGLAFPEDDETAGLEWVSRFVDDSPSEFPFPLALPVKWTEPEPEPESDRSESSLVPRKPRTKRIRRSSLSQLSESSSSSSSSSSSCSSHLFVFPRSPVRFVQMGEPERKKQKPKKKLLVQSGPQFMRRCSHCQVQKTPQWRTGPNGAKTLCNACGVRFKSGRLFPEYRPACSPTFSSEVHSNSHRKVLEMRKKKDGPVQPGSGLARAISSF